MIFEFVYDSALTNAIVGIALVILVDAVLGILVALKKHEFDPYRVPEFFLHNMLPLVGGLVLLGAFSYVLPLFRTIFAGVSAAIGIKYITTIIGKFATLFEIELDIPVMADYLEAFKRRLDPPKEEEETEDEEAEE